MPAVYPMSVKSWIPKVDQVDTIWAAHVNDIQNELAAIEKTVGTNPHVWGGWSPGGTAWPPKAGSMTLKTSAPVSNFGQGKAFLSVADRLKSLQEQTTWLTLMTQLLVGQSGTKPSKPAAAVIRAPGMKVPAGEGKWVPFKWAQQISTRTRCTKAARTSSRLSRGSGTSAFRCGRIPLFVAPTICISYTSGSCEEARRSPARTRSSRPRRGSGIASTCRGRAAGIQEFQCRYRSVSTGPPTTPWTPTRLSASPSSAT